MPKHARTFLTIPLVVLLLLVVLPSLLISLTAETPPVLGSTVPPATRTPRPRPTGRPTQTPTRTPTPTLTVTPTVTITSSATRVFTPSVSADARVKANGYLLQMVIGNRLSPTIYGLTMNGRLYRSPSDGRTWQLVTSRPVVDDFIFGPQDAGILYAGTLECAEAQLEPHVLRSQDGGAGWSALATGVSLLPLLVDPADSKVVLASGCDGIHVTDDGGESWQQRSVAGADGIPEGFVVRQIAPVYYAITADSMEQKLDVLYAAAFDEDGAAVVLLSEDAGATWSVITPWMDGVDLRITALTADVMTQGRVWFSDERGVWGTADDGQTWGFTNRGLDADVVLQALVYHPAERLYLGSGRGLYTRPTEGKRWSVVGERSLSAQDIRAVFFTDSMPRMLWLNTDAGVFKYLVP